MSDLLSLEALEWLKSVDYSSKNHEERMILIQAAKIAYPDPMAGLISAFYGE